MACGFKLARVGAAVGSFFYGPASHGQKNASKLIQPNLGHKWPRTAFFASAFFLSLLSSSCPAFKAGRRPTWPHGSSWIPCVNLTRQLQSILKCLPHPRPKADRSTPQAACIAAVSTMAQLPPVSGVTYAPGTQLSNADLRTIQSSVVGEEGFLETQFGDITTQFV